MLPYSDCTSIQGMERMSNEEWDGTTERRHVNPPVSGIVVPHWLAAVVSAAMLAGLGFLYQQNQSNIGFFKTEITVLNVKLDAVSQQLKQGTDLRYRSTDAAADFGKRDQRMDFIQKQLDHHEGELRQLQIDVLQCQKNVEDKK